MTAAAARIIPAMLRWNMPVRFQKSGCLWSIVISVFLTIMLNVMLRACAGGSDW